MDGSRSLERQNGVDDDHVDILYDEMTGTKVLQFAD